MKKILALTLVALFTLTGVVGCGIFDSDALSYVTVDINPSFEIVVKGDRAVSVTALNEDADTVLAEITIDEDATAEEVLAQIVAVATDLGFLNENNTDVTLTVLDEKADEGRIEKMYKKLENVVKAHAEKAENAFVQARREANSAALSLMELQADPAYADNEAVQALNPGHYRLIREVMENCDLTLEEALALNVQELIEELHEARDAQRALSAEERKAANKARKEAQKQAMKDAKDQFAAELEDILGMPIPELAGKKAAEDLAKLLEEYLDEIEDTELTDEEITALAEIFGVTEAQLMQMVRDEEIELADVFKLANRAIDRRITPEEREAILKELHAFIEEIKARAMTEALADPKIAALIAELNIPGLEEALRTGDLKEMLKVLTQAGERFADKMEEYRESFSMPEFTMPDRGSVASSVHHSVSVSISDMVSAGSAPAQSRPEPKR